MIVPNNGTTYYNDVITNAIQYAQTIEQAAFKMLNLSIQELLDCDTSADQGCTVSQWATENVSSKISSRGIF